MAYTLKRAAERDFVVGPLEGLWWADDLAAFTVRVRHKKKLDAGVRFEVLGDSRRTAPEKLRTVLRQPVARKPQ